MIDWPDIRTTLSRWLMGMALIALWFLTATAICPYENYCSQTTLTYLNLIGLTGIIVVGARAAIALMRAEKRLLFTPLVAYAAASALYFGFGPMSTFLAGEATLSFQARSVYRISAYEVLRTNLLSSVGIAISLGTMVMIIPKRLHRVAPRNVISFRSIALIFLISGLVLKHLVIMPSIYGTAAFQIPGMMRNLRYLPDLGFAIAAMIAASGDKRWQILFWTIWPWHLLLAFPEFSKKSVMLTILLPAIGAFLGHRSLKRLAVWMLAAILIFAGLQNVNAISRWELLEAERQYRSLGVRDRLDILVSSGVSTDDVNSYLPDAKVGVETWWLRLNYSGPQAAAMALYDQGITSTFTQNILVYLVPRVFWPDKPTLVSPGREFHSIVIGQSRTNTRVGITVFADGYWKLGWFGVFLWSSLVGVIYAVLTRLTMTQLARGQYLYLPAAMLGLQMGATSITAFFQNAFLSAIPTYIGFCIVVYFVYQVLQSMSTRKTTSLDVRKPHPRVLSA